MGSPARRPGPGQVGLDIQARLGLCFAARKIIRAGLELQFSVFQAGLSGFGPGLHVRVLKNSIRAWLSGFGLDFGPGSGLKTGSILGFGLGSGLRNEGRAFTSPARNPARPDVCPGLVQAAPNPSHIWGAMSLSELSAMLFPTRGPNTTQNPTP